MTVRYEASRTALLHVDPYNDFLSEGGKLWDRSRETIEGVGLLDNSRRLVVAAGRHDILRIIVPHRRWQPTDYQDWKHVSPSQRGVASLRLFAAGEWGGEIREEFAPAGRDVLAQEHWAASGFANTDLDFQLKQHDISHVVLIGMRANTCIDTTARFAQELGYHVTLIRDAIGAFSWGEMTATFETNAPTYAHEILTTGDFITSVEWR